MTEEAREFVREELRSIAQVLSRKYGMAVPDIQKFLKDMLSVSI
jgi:hypothetical protein